MLTEERLAFKPFAYPDAYKFWRLQQEAHWMTDRINMSDDVRDWNFRMTPEEKNVGLHIMRFFTQADVEVGNCYHRHYLQIFKPIEVQMMLIAFANMETIHADAYSHLNTTLGIPDSEYSAFLEYEALREKHDYMRGFKADDPMSVAETMAAFGGFTEGMQLFASFAILMNFPRFGKMKGMGQIVTYSVRDETLHCRGITWLFHQWLLEHPEIDRRELERRVHAICRTMVAQEDKFIDLAFELGSIPGLTAAEVKSYVRFIADHRLRSLGMTPIYHIEKHPLPWMEEMLGAPEHVNFFEQASTEYSKGATKGSWDDVFA